MISNGKTETQLVIDAIDAGFSELIRSNFKMYAYAPSTNNFDRFMLGVANLSKARELCLAEVMKDE